jgi:hypothetical protein
MCAAAWDGVTHNLAQKIAGKNRGDHLQLRHWQRFAADCELNAPGCWHASGNCRARYSASCRQQRMKWRRCLLGRIR